MKDVPAGFKLFGRVSPFTEMLGPLYSSGEGRELVIGVFGLSGFLATLGGGLQGYSLAYATPDRTVGPLIFAATATLLGGVPLAGGRGNPLGIAAGVLCFFAATTVKKAFGYDDSLDAFGVHCIGGITGAILTGVFNVKDISGADASVMTQLYAVIATLAYSGIVSFILLKVIDMVVGLRVSEEEEREGLDVSLHGERVE